MTGRRRVVTWAAPHPPPPTLSGLDSVQALASGALPPPPVAALVGFSLTHVEPGAVRMTLAPAEYHYNPIGTVHGGIGATVLEAALAAAIRTTLPPGRACITVEIKINYVRALTAGTGDVTVEGRVVHAGRQVALAEGRITDAAGRLYVTATSTCLIQGATAEPAVPDAPGWTAERSRVIEWEDAVAGARRIASLPGLSALRDHRFTPPIALLIGMTLDSVDEGCVRMSLPPGEHLFSQFGAVHGGMTATLLDSVLGCAIHTTLPAGQGYTTLELKVSLLRAITAESGLVTATGQAVHTGRRMATAEARAVDAQGRLCATATTTCLVFEARAA